MKITVTKTYELTYSVQYFDQTEGGMDNGSFGDQVKTIEEAVSLLEIARVTRSDEDWVIVVEVETKVTKS